MANDTNKTAMCKVEWTGWDWDDMVQVTSPTGGVVRIYIVRAKKGWSTFNEAEQALFQKLMQGKWNEVRLVELTYAEMAMFKAAAVKATKRD